MHDIDILGSGFGMISAKVTNQASVLKYFRRYRLNSNPELAARLGEKATDVRQLSRQVLGLDPTIHDCRQVCMGRKWRDAALYWSGFLSLVPESYTFRARSTRNARDVVNQCLNYLYGLLYGEVWQSVLVQGLDPYFGIIHGSKRNQGSLVFDLIEEFRAPYADRILLGLFGRRFKPALSRDGLPNRRPRPRLVLIKAFMKKWHKSIQRRGKEITPSKILKSQARSLRRLFSEAVPYRAYRYQW
jgi:CRISPR-associated protein Cas1